MFSVTALQVDVPELAYQMFEEGMMELVGKNTERINFPTQNTRPPQTNLSGMFQEKGNSGLWTMGSQRETSVRQAMRTCSRIILLGG